MSPLPADIQALLSWGRIAFFRYKETQQGENKTQSFPFVFAVVVALTRLTQLHKFCIHHPQHVLNPLEGAVLNVSHKGAI